MENQMSSKTSQIPKKVSVIIPNYNHETFLKQRIDSVLNQTFRDFEVIILDDSSTDNSKEVISTFASNPHVSHIVYNEQNSGSTFFQWKKGIDLAAGKYIWIAESDDIADINFLIRLVSVLESNNKIGISYCNSQIINSSGHSIMVGGLNFTPAQMHDHFQKPFINSGKEEAKNHHIYSNNIPNASAVVFRRDLFDPGFLKTDMKICGDWYFWFNLLQKCDVYYTNEVLNYFRTHEHNVRLKVKNSINEFNEFLIMRLLQLKTVQLSKVEKSILLDKSIFQYFEINGKTRRNPKTIKLLSKTILLFGWRKGFILYLKNAIKKGF